VSHLEGSSASGASISFGDARYIALLLAAALALASVARLKSGSWSSAWYGHRPVVWLVLTTAVPPLAIALLLTHHFTRQPSTPAGGKAQ
jgi:nitrate/nitrite transporter NarK